MIRFHARQAWSKEALQNLLNRNQMDKKNTILGILFLAAGMGFMFWQSKEAADYERQRALEEALSGEESGTVASDTAPEVTLPVDAEAAPMLNLLVQEASVQRRQMNRMYWQSRMKTVTLRMNIW